jgi:putative spermidine/putrescine transport system ATP-binding protein
LLQLNNIETTSAIGGTVLHNINMQVLAQDKVAIMGETGCGKTTLLKTIAGFIQHSAGQISFNDKIIKGPDHQLIAGNAGIGYLSQQSDLRHNYKMQDLLDYANTYDKIFFNELIDICNVRHLLLRNSRQLSGGEKQRLALVKVLLEKPQLIILDEPFTNLDQHHATTMRDILTKLGKQNFCSFLMSAHSKEEVLSWADYLYIMHEGQIIQEGHPTHIYFQPKNLYVAELLGDFTLINSSIKTFFSLSDDILYLRPEQLHITDAQPTNSTVIDVKHYGGYYKYKLALQDEILITNSIQHFTQGLQVCVQYNAQWQP